MANPRVQLYLKAGDIGTVSNKSSFPEKGITASLVSAPGYSGFTILDLTEFEVFSLEDNLVRVCRKSNPQVLDETK